jgi:hypothetical protein
MTNREIVSRVRNSIKEHRIDSVLTNKHIYNILYSNSALLIKREADAKKSVYSLSNIWSSYCVKLEEVSSITCDVPFSSDCTILRSVEKLPEFVETSTGFLYKSITTLDGSKQYSLTTPYQYSIKSKIKYNKSLYVFIEDGYLYVPNSKFKFLKILAYFKKPQNSNCKDCVKKCSSLDNDFPCPDYLIQAVIEMSMKEFGFFKGTPYDQITNKNESNSLT